MAGASDSVVNRTKIVCADFCQGNERFSSFSRGRQCVANCITFIMKSYLKRIEEFDSHDVNSVLIYGDTLYQKLRNDGHNQDFLHFSDLPEFIVYHGRCFTISGQKTYVGTMCQKGGLDGLGLSLESSLNSVSSMVRQEVPLLLTFHSAAIAIKFYKRTGAYYVFDSHSRGSDGLCCPDGKAVITVFYSLDNICLFLRNLCVSLSRTIPLEKTQYELCLFQISNSKKRKRGAVDIDCTLDLQCHLVKPVAEQNESFISKCGTLRTESQTLHTNHSSPPEHINIKVSDQNDSDQEILDINPLTTEKNVHHNSGLCSYEKIIENKIQSFHKKVSHGPVYVCSCCTQTWFKESVHNAIHLQNSTLAMKCLTGFISVDNIEWVCNTCYNNIKANKVPALAVVNGMGFPPKTQELFITELEERLISPRIPFM